MATTTTPDTERRNGTLAERIAGWRYLGLSSFLFAFLQALCPAVIAFSAVRVAIGLGALAVAAGTDLPARGWHGDWVRIPMMLLAALGAFLNLFVIWHVRRLRARPSAQWRVGPLSERKLRSERLQGRASGLRDRGLECVEAIVQRQQRVLAKGNDDGFLFD